MPKPIIPCLMPSVQVLGGEREGNTGIKTTSLRLQVWTLRSYRLTRRQLWQSGYANKLQFTFPISAGIKCLCITSAVFLTRNLLRLAAHCRARCYLFCHSPLSLASIRRQSQLIYASELMTAGSAAKSMF